MHTAANTIKTGWYSNPKIEIRMSNKPIEVAVLNIKLASCTI